GLPGREVLPRLQALHDRRGDLRDPAAGHRPPDPRRLKRGRAAPGARVAPSPGARLKMAQDLLEKALGGDLRALGRALTVIENGGAPAHALVARAFPLAGRARVVGLTGPPGVGKSSLTDRLTAHYRARGLKVAVVAVDPTSPFSGGAILGDRIRMVSHFTD